MKVWGTCARTECGVKTLILRPFQGGVFMYLSKQSEDHRSKTLMSPGGELAEAAVVAAPIRKL